MGLRIIPETFSKGSLPRANEFVAFMIRGGCLGSANIFGELMRVACSEDAGKISFLDQDDVRLPTKMKEQVDASDTKEESHGRTLQYSFIQVSK